MSYISNGKMEARHFQSKNPNTGEMITVYLWIDPNGSWGWRNPEIWDTFKMSRPIPTTFGGKAISLLQDKTWVFVA